MGIVSRTPVVALVATAVSMCLCAGRASAQAAPSTEELLRRIDGLEAQIAELRAIVNGAASAPGPAAATGASTASPAATRDVTFGVSLDAYYMFNPRFPIGRVNLLRAYDVLSNNFSLNQASVVVESAADPGAGRRFGGRLDLQWGMATETVQGNLMNEPRPWVYRNVFQAYGTYVAPVGSGLKIDFGKWAGSLGYEGNYTKDQMNYSRSYWFNFLPFYHMGARVNYQLSDAVALNYWVTNGAQNTEAFNNFKDQFVGVVMQPAKAVTWTAQYYFGQEHPDVQTIESPGFPTLPTQPGLSVTPVTPYFTGKLHIFDSYASWQLSPSTTLAVEGDYVINRNPAPAIDSRVSGGSVYARRQLSPRSAVAARAEYLRDRGGLFTGVTQSVKEATVTYDFTLAEGFLVRSEWRRDLASTPFFFTHDAGVLDAAQDTATIGVIWWWGTKRNAW